jgi:hypothetical protein
VALDSAPIHIARLIEHWLADQPRVTALWLPKYAAHEHHPVECIWRRMKPAVVANRSAGSMDALIQVARDFLAEMRPHSGQTLARLLKTEVFLLITCLDIWCLQAMYTERQRDLEATALAGQAVLH